MSNIVKVKAFWFILSVKDRESVATECEARINQFFQEIGLTGTRFLGSDTNMFQHTKVDGYICALHIYYTV